MVVRLVVLFLATLTTFIASTASAGIVTYSWSGLARSIYEDNDPWNLGYDVPQSYAFSFSIDQSAADRASRKYRQMMT